MGPESSCRTGPDGRGNATCSVLKCFSGGSNRQGKSGNLNSNIKFLPLEEKTSTPPKKAPAIQTSEIKECGAPIGTGAFGRSWLAAKADELAALIQKATITLPTRPAHAANTVTYYPSLSLADYVCATNLPS